MKKVLNVVLMVVLSISMFAASSYKPFVLAKLTKGSQAMVLKSVKDELLKGGFEIVGEYSPYEGTNIVIITNDILKENAKNSKFGAYGAAQRVSVTKVNKEIQVAFTNPSYMAYAYKMKSNLSDVKESLQKSLGFVKEYGIKKGLKSKDLKKYHYMAMMPYFKDHKLLAKYDNFSTAINAVEANLKAKKGGVSKVYRIDIPGKNETVFGVAMTKKLSNDKKIMSKIDKGSIKSSAHLPYEIIVSEGSVYTLHGKFRIALNFPDLTMGTFMKIKSAPGDIFDSLKKVAK